MGKKYLDTKKGTLESSILGVWKTAAEENAVKVDGRTKGYKTHREKLEAARLRREKKNLNKEEVELDESGRLGFKDIEKFGRSAASRIDNEARRTSGYDKMSAGQKDELRYKIAKKLGMKVEEVKLDEKNKITGKEIDFDLYSDEKGAKAANKTMNREIRKASQMKDYKTARKYMDKIQKKYSELGAEDTEPESIITSILGRVFKEEVQIDEMFGISSNSNHRAKTMKMLDGMGIKYKKDGRNGLIILGVAPKDQKGILDKIHKDIGMTTYRIMDEEVELDEASVMVDLENDNPKLMKDIKKMGIKVKDLGDSGNRGYNEYKLTGSPAALKKGGKKFGWDQQVEKVQVKEGKMSQLHQLMKDGKTAEEIAKIMRVDAKTIKKLMPESYEIGTDEYRKHTEDVTPGQDGEWVDAVNKKNESMREALARVWEVTEDKNPFKKEDKKDLTKEVKDGKTMTGKKIASVDVNPTIKEKAK